MMQSIRSARRGFTILELLIVMFMAAIVGGMSMGKMHDIMMQQRVIRAASTIRTSVEDAFAIASRNRKPVRLVWDATNMQFDVTDRAGTTIYRHVGLGQDPYRLPQSAVTFSSSPVEIYPNGLAGSSLTITLSTALSASTAARTITVSRAGMVQVLAGTVQTQ
ncbi:MAG TPA: prepilin-type N-terminal cleavage/methylation domain-containing protein [Gemmatimonadaceae bacterium]|jgi:prepilin-type N-terminal cleavage/methylation domain-containing protein|nr:prepilin-type N-terminal cleavage/methylation domain-containing protein [Gemmatimonadaceae bacterium]